MSDRSSEKSRIRDCVGWRPLLDDFVDGELPDERMASVRRHLEGCASCRRDVVATEELLAAAGALPASLEPEADLWSGIEARLTPRRPAESPARVPVPPRRWTRWIPQAAAAVLLVGFGALLAQLMGPSVAPYAEIDSDGESAYELAALERRAELASAEADYLRVKESLWLTVYNQRHLLSPMTVEVVDHNLKTIDSAIQEIRQALDEDPGNRHLEGLLFANHRRGIDLLRRLAKVSQEI